MVHLRRCAAWVTVSCLAFAVAGCSTETSGSGSATKFASTVAPGTSVAPTPGYDVARISHLQDDFPAGFIPGPPSTPIKVTQQLVATIGTVVSYGQPFTVNPARCRPLLKPVDGQLGADSMHVRGDELSYRQISVGATNPVTVSDQIPSAGCDRFTYDVADDDRPLSGSVELIAPPNIDGAVTFAVRFDVTGSPNVEYSYAAILDGRVYVDVQARLTPEFPAEPVLSALLVRTVATVRGG